MVHNFLEELYDGLLFLIGLMGVLIFFLMYWNDSFKVRYAEVVLQDFLRKVSVTGKMTKYDYEGLRGMLYSIEANGDLEIKCIQYVDNPEYRMFTENELSAYFQSRNKRADEVMEEYVFPRVPIQEENLKYQDETNASLLAAKKAEYLPLPGACSELEISAVRPVQEVYEGEKLITLCRVSSQNMNCYVEAPEVIAKESGEIDLEVTIEETGYIIPIQVICHPRTVQCKNGHTVLNDKRVLEEYKKSGTVLCIYCSMLPKTISCEKSELRLKTGEQLTGEKIGVWVEYLDGGADYITPESEEWKDDYDETFCGKQTVTIRYRNAETKLTIISENGGCIQCGGECNEKSAEDYESYPYCLSCLSEMYIFTGTVFSEEQLIYEAELLSALEEEQEMVFFRGDYVVVEFAVGRHKTVVQKKVLINGTSGISE